MKKHSWSTFFKRQSETQRANNLTSFYSAIHSLPSSFSLPLFLYPFLFLSLFFLLLHKQGMLLGRSRIISTSRFKSLSLNLNLTRRSYHLCSISISTRNNRQSSFRMTNDDDNGKGNNSNLPSISRLASLTRQLLPSRPLVTPSSGNHHPATEHHQEEEEVIGHLTIGPQVRIPITNPKQDALNRLPANRLLLDLDDVAVLENLEWLGKKWSLGEDVL